MHIARDYLEKATREACGIKPEQVEVTAAALLELIENYCREAGVRNLQKQIEKIYHKVDEVIDIEEKAGGDAEVDKVVFHADKIYDQTPVGVVMGLAWTALGGSTLYIETMLVEQGEGKGALHITGQFGDVMKENAQIAHTVAQAILLEKVLENPFFANSKLHLHVPAGATPKDGPNAGCTMITSLLSLAIKRPVKEKTIAARRIEVKIIFSTVNRRDFDELSDNLKEGLAVHFVDDYSQIFELAFGSIDIILIVS